VAPLYRWTISPPDPPAGTSPEPLYKWAIRWVSKLILKQIYEETKIIDMRKFITYFFRIISFVVKFEIDTISG
jgi:hypothetical protein